MYELVEKLKGCLDSTLNLLLSVPTDPEDKIPEKWIEPLM